MTTDYLGNVGLKQEATFGEEASPPDVFEAILSESMTMESEEIRPSSANGMRASRFTIPGRITAGGDLNTVLSPEGAVPWMLKGVFGKVESSQVATGVYDHVFTPLNTKSLPSFTAQTNIAEMSESWLGCTFSGMSLSVVKNQLVTLDISVLSQRSAESSATTTASFAAAMPFQSDDFVFTLNGNQNLKFESFNLNVRNDIEVVHTMNGKRYCSKHHVRGLDISGSITLEFENEIERRRLWGSLTARTPQNVIEPGSLVAVATHSGEAAAGHPFTFTINISELRYQSAPANISREQDRVTQRIFFRPSWNNNADEIMSFSMRNSVASYPDPA